MCKINCSGPTKVWIKDNNTCPECNQHSPKCTQCEDLTGVCKGCEPSYYLAKMNNLNPACLKCDKGDEKTIHCTTCTQKAVGSQEISCTACNTAAGYEWVNYYDRCKKICDKVPLNTWRQSNNTCMNCSYERPHCTSCLNSTTICQQCATSYFLNSNKKCIKQCNNNLRLYLNETSNSCNTCETHCTVCANVTGYCQGCN